MTSKPTSTRVLFHLKTTGPTTAKDIASRFDMTHMGAHKVLQGLVEAGLVRFEDVAGGRGRPKRRYQLTANGHAQFPDRHGDMTVELIDNVRKIFGDKGLDKLIAEREAQQVARYADLPGDLKQRTSQLAKMRDSEGYMARVEADPNGDLLLIEDHCPICAAATRCQGFCRSELAIFQMVLGKDVNIVREEHLLSDGRRCAYRIRKATP